MANKDLTPQERADVKLLRNSKLFDAKFYLESNRAIARAGVDPVLHYLRTGAKDGLDPSAEFSTTAYLKANPDVQRSGNNPLIHFLRSGRVEGRSPNPQRRMIELVRASGMWDEEYYRHFRPDVPADIDALKHYLNHGADEGFDPSEGFSSKGYLRFNPDVASKGVNPLVHYLTNGRDEGRQSGPGRPRYPEVRRAFAERWPNLVSFQTLPVRGVGPRVTILTDSVGASSFYGGVGTALMLGIELANQHGASLRLATRHDPPDPGVLGSLQAATGVALAGQLEVVHLPVDSNRPLTLGDQDLILTTSWWTTRATLSSTVPRESVLYLLQEDERMFYPYGDERLLCSETLGEPNLKVVVNTSRLLAHLRLDYPDLHATSFEPAFPGGEAAEDCERSGKRKFFFYSRPENARNLFWRGVTAIAEAIERNVLDPAEWDIYFVGRSTPPLSLPRGVRPIVLEGLSWAEYQALVTKMDAALSLMDTPHPSYPPLDMAAAGVAVLTNRHPGKDDLDKLSANILMADLRLDSLARGLEELVQLGRDDAARLRNRNEDKIGRDWNANLAQVVTELAPQVGSILGAGGHVH